MRRVIPGEAVLLRRPRALRGTAAIVRRPVSGGWEVEFRSPAGMPTHVVLPPRHLDAAGRSAAPRP